MLIGMFWIWRIYENKSRIWFKDYNEPWKITSFFLVAFIQWQNHFIFCYFFFAPIGPEPTLHLGGQRKCLCVLSLPSTTLPFKVSLSCPQLPAVERCSREHPLCEGEGKFMFYELFLITFSRIEYVHLTLVQIAIC